MKTYISDGSPLELVAPYAVTGGQMFKVGSILAVAAGDAANGAAVVGHTIGVFSLAKVGSQAWAVGDVVYWDDTNKYLTTTASGNTRAGHAVAAVGSGAGLTTGTVRINLA